MITMLRGQRQFQQEKQKKTLYNYSLLSLFHGSIIPDVTKLEVVCKETGTRLIGLPYWQTGYPDSGENWDYQNRLRGEWIHCL
jgi:hypothetical protein